MSFRRAGGVAEGEQDALLEAGDRTGNPVTPHKPTGSDIELDDYDSKSKDTSDHVLPVTVPGVRTGGDKSAAAPTRPLYLTPVFAAIVVVSFFTRFYSLGTPNSVVFDEVHFGKFANWYMTGKYFFDIHPPLGKLVLALWGKMIGYDAHYPFATIGQAYDTGDYYYLRMCPAFFSSLLAPATYLLIHEIGLSTPTALLGTAMILFDNCIVGEGKFILVDSQLFFWIIMSLWCHFASKKRTLYTREWYLWTAGAGLCLALASSVKWTGLATVGIVGLDVAADLLSRLPQENDDNLRAWVREFVTKLMLYLIIPIGVYFFIFAIHFWCLPHSGSGDDFMSWEFKARLQGVNVPSHIKPKGLIASIFELQSVMYRSNSGLTAKHSWGSTWVEWPTLSGKGVLYWTQNNGRIYLLGNPLIWWLSTAGLCVMFWALIKPIMRSPLILDIPETYNSKRERILGQRRWAKVKLGVFFIVGYLLNWVPYIMITRVCFIYHYIPSLIFAIFTTCVVFDYLVEHNGLKFLLSMGVILLVALTFWYFMPWTWGFPLDNAGHEARRWREIWT